MSLSYTVRVAGPLVLCFTSAWTTPAVADVGTLADSNGEVVAWGYNGYGQTIVPAGTFVSVSAGDFHNLGIREDGTLVGWGSNLQGQSTVPSGTFAAVAAGYGFSLGIRSDGTLAGWGDDTHGQATVPTGIYTAAAGGFLHSLGIKSDDTLAGWGDNSLGQAAVPSGTFTAVAAGGYHSLGIRTNGTLAGWGYNTFGQTAVPSGTFTATAAGFLHSLGIRTNGTLAGWGQNADGQTTVPTGAFTAVSAGYDHSLGIRADGTLAGWGNNSHGQTTVPSGVFVNVAAGDGHSLAMRARTEYDGDLAVSFTGDPYGPNGLLANLNRSITVAGDMRVESGVYLMNQPTVTIGGKLSLEPGGWLNVVDSATIATGGGIEVTEGAWLFVPANLTLNSTGPLIGGGTVEIEANLSARLTDASVFTGTLMLWPGASMNFSGTGFITPTYVDVQPDSELRLAAGQRLVTGTAYNAGRIEALGNANVLGGVAEVEFRNGAYNEFDTGLITGHDAVFRFGPGTGLGNGGAIALTGGANDIFGDLNNELTGTVAVTGGAQATFYDDVVNDGMIVVRALGGSHSTAVFLGDYTGSGSTSGGGVILFEGDLRPGNSPASIEMGNNVGLGPGARLEIQVGGTTPGDQYDQLLVTGEVALGGTLDVELIDAGSGMFVPSAGDSFHIITADGGLGGTAFATELLPALAGGLFFDVAYGADSVALNVGGVLGDYNLNGIVDAADYTVWRDMLGQSGAALAADGDASGIVDEADYTVWKTHYGDVAGSGAGSLAATTSPVPEPATWLVMIGGLILPGCLRNRRRDSVVRATGTNAV